MKTISLTKGKVALVDDADFAYLSQFKWCICNGYAASRMGGGELVYLHRLLTHAPVGTDVDHINGDALDNRRSNLRVCTHQDNVRNRRRLNRNNTSGHKGVGIAGDGRRWRTTIVWKGRQVWLGQFDSYDDAVAVRRGAERQLFGEFAA